MQVRPQLKFEPAAPLNRGRAFRHLLRGEKLIGGWNRKVHARTMAAIGHGNPPQIGAAPLLLDQDTLFLEGSQSPPQRWTTDLEHGGQLALGPQAHSCLGRWLGKRPDQGFDDDLAGDSGHVF